MKSCFCLAAPRSGEGKTTLSIALMRALVRRGLGVQAFKCGPDYIDPTFHAQATGRAAYNLDTWMMGKHGVRALWARHASHMDVGVCEGVMGLLDGRDVGSLEGSTLGCAQALDLPLILVCNVRGMAASIAALVEGFQRHAQRAGVALVGIIGNQAGSSRHVEILRRALEYEGLPPFLGACPRNPDWALPERQLGLIPSDELGTTEAWLDALGTSAAQHIDIDRLLALTATHTIQKQNTDNDTMIDAARQPCQTKDTHGNTNLNQSKHRDTAASAQCEALKLAAATRGFGGDYPPRKKKRLGIAKDKAFCFYYEENEHALRANGWELVPFSPLIDTMLPASLDAVYLGGGYPETFAAELSANVGMRRSIAAFAEQGGEIYAECGGYMYLCSYLEAHEESDGTKGTRHSWPMCGIIDATATMGQGIRSLGYREVELFTEAPFGLQAQRFRGHEFHWSNIVLHREYSPLYTVKTRTGTEVCGVNLGHVKAGYIHLYWGIGAWSAVQATTMDTPTAHNSISTNDTQQQGLLILLNGASSAGKTTLAKALQACLFEKHGVLSVCFSIDDFLKGLPNQPETVVAGVASMGCALIHSFHAAVATAVEGGALVIADHVIGEEEAWIADLYQRVGAQQILPVQVSCELKTLQQREEQRTDRTADWPHAARQAHNIHRPLPKQIHVDTTKTSPKACAESIILAFETIGFHTRNPNIL